ncbi:MAG: hypothetical protein KGO50_01205 [Myxococcales bacterium]|nr:hypothetical protein [Myxococcales bacterium]
MTVFSSDELPGVLPELAPSSTLRVLMKYLSLCLVVSCVLFACHESGPEWPEDERDARSYPKESQGADLACDNEDLRFVGSGLLSRCPQGLDDLTCEDLGLTGGSIPCGNCGFDLSVCSGSACGNSLLEADERCEVDGQRACEVPSGSAPCTACSSACEPVEEASCGNGVAEYPAEECDGDDFFMLIPGRVSPNLSSYDPATLRCDIYCRVDFGDALPATCGNGLLEGGEECERDQSGFVEQDGVRLRCVDCLLEEQPGTCGDGLLQRDFEDCDGSNFAFFCESNGPGWTGDERCNADCTATLDCQPPADDTDASGFGDTGLPDGASEETPDGAERESNGCSVSSSGRVQPDLVRWVAPMFLGMITFRRLARRRSAAA